MTNLTRITLTALLLGLAMPHARAQSSDSTRYRTKLESPFVKAIPWELDLAKAMEKALAMKKPILAYFTRSYSP